MPNASYATAYLDFIAQALHASGNLHATVEAQSAALLEVVDATASRIGLVDSQAQVIAGKFGFKDLHFGPADPLTKAQELHSAGIDGLNEFWEDGACDLDALSIAQLPARWQKKIEDQVVASLQMIREIEHRLELFPKGWAQQLQQSKLELVSHDTLKSALVYHEAEHLLADRVAAWEALQAQGSIALFDLHAVATHAATQELQEKVVAAQAEQVRLCAKVVQQRQQAEEERKREEQRKRDEALRLEEERKLEAKRKLEEEQRLEKERQREEQRRIEEERRLEEQKKQELQWEQDRLAREQAMRREAAEKAARLAQEKQAEEERKRKEQRKRDEALRLEEDRKLEAKRKLEEEQRLENARHREEQRRLEEKRHQEEQKKQKLQLEHSRLAREEAMRRAAAEKAARLTQESRPSKKELPSWLPKVAGAAIALALAKGLLTWGALSEPPAPSHPAQTKSGGSYSGYRPDQNWMRGGLYGHDNEVAALKRVTITGGEGDYRVHISNQFGFRCRIYFDANGDPARLSDCAAEDANWIAVPNGFRLTCSSPGDERVCSGHYTLKSEYYSTVSEMKIARRQ
jgi:hypothetical protein